MPFLNNYKPTSPSNPITPDNDNRDTPLEEYDFNFVYPVTTLQSDRVELRPLLPSRDGKTVAKVFADCPEIMLYDGWPLDYDGIFANMERGRKASTNLTYAIYTSPPSSTCVVPPEEFRFAGSISIHDISEADLSCELGLFIFPEFQRTHVATHAMGLALKRSLDMPIPGADGSPVSDKGGFGYRRVLYTCDMLNLASSKLATRMGFKFEGTRRNMHVIPAGKPADGCGRPGDLKDGEPSINQWMGSVTCKDWEEGGAEIVYRQMARTSGS